ncbi:MAG: pantothenate kinase, partial [Chloroflexota bacterium]
MLLAIDIGNTNVVVGLWPGGDDPDTEELCATWRLASARERTADEWQTVLQPLLAGALGDAGRVSAVIISSVVPAISRAINQWAHTQLGIEPLVVSPDLELGIHVRTDAPY